MSYCKGIIFLSLIVIVDVAGAQAYRCEFEDGSISFQSIICDSDDVVNITTYQDQPEQIVIGQVVITMSRLEQENSRLREQQLTDWMHRSELQKFLDEEVKNGYFSLYMESHGSERRMLLYPTPIGMSWSTRSARPEGSFLSFNKKFMDDGKRLLTLHIDHDPENSRRLYTATWVSDDRFDEAREICQQYGISVAAVTGFLN